MVTQLEFWLMLVFTALIDYLCYLLQQQINNKILITETVTENFTYQEQVLLITTQ